MVNQISVTGVPIMTHLQIQILSHSSSEEPWYRVHHGDGGPYCIQGQLGDVRTTQQKLALGDLRKQQPELSTC